MRQQAKYNIKKYIDERLPEEYEKRMVGLTSFRYYIRGVAGNYQAFFDITHHMGYQNVCPNGHSRRYCDGFHNGYDAEWNDDP
jgi:hypothetical protein